MTNPSAIIPMRLTERLEASDLSQTELARRVGVTQGTVAKLANGLSSGSKHIALIAQELGTTAAYLTGQTDDPKIGATLLPTAAQISEQLDLVQVNEIDLRFGMGGGAYFDAPIKAEAMSFSKAWLAHFTSASPDNLFFAKGIGDSMQPTIYDGDIVLIDRSQKQPMMGDQIWAITQYGHGMIKRLRPTENGYKILSDNQSVPPDTAMDGSMDIIGRVIAVVRRL